MSPVTASSWYLRIGSPILSAAGSSTAPASSRVTAADRRCRSLHRWGFQEKAARHRLKGRRACWRVEKIWDGSGNTRGPRGKIYNALLLRGHWATPFWFAGSENKRKPRTPNRALSRCSRSRHPTIASLLRVHTWIALSIHSFCFAIRSSSAGWVLRYADPFLMPFCLAMASIRRKVCSMAGRVRVRVPSSCHHTRTRKHHEPKKGLFNNSAGDGSIINEHHARLRWGGRCRCEGRTVKWTRLPDSQQVCSECVCAHMAETNRKLRTGCIAIRKKKPRTVYLGHLVGVKTRLGHELQPNKVRLAFHLM